MGVNAYLYGGPRDGKLVRLEAPGSYVVVKPVSLPLLPAPTAVAGVMHMTIGCYTPLAVWQPPLNPIDGDEPLHLYVWGGWSDEPPLPTPDRDQVCIAATRRRVAEYQQERTRQAPRRSARERLNGWLDDTAWVDSPDAYHWIPDNEPAST